MAVQTVSDTLERLRERSVFDRLTQAMRDADRLFESGKTGGGGTRHYIRDCLEPALAEWGLSVVSSLDGHIERGIAEIEAGLAQVRRDNAQSELRLAEAKLAALDSTGGAER